MPKYFVRAVAAMRSPATHNGHVFRSRKPVSQRQIVQTHNASIGMSHITLVAESRNTGVLKVKSATINGLAPNLSAKR